MKSNLDKIYRRLLVTKFFEKGWGKPENLQKFIEFRKQISKRETCFKLIPFDYPVHITKREVLSESTVLEGKFLTPLELYLPGVVPEAARDAHFQIILPNKWKREDFKPICIHLAGTGDHYFWRRRNFIVKPLLKEANMGAIILENPFYGMRKPDDQVRSNLHNVSDIFVMGGCLILECLVLLHWCERNGFGPLGVTGLSMGGHMASLAACNWPKPLVLVPCLSWSTGSAVFTQGVMSQSINWDRLETEYFSNGYYSEKLSQMVTIVDEAFTAGKTFVKNSNKSLDDLKTDIQTCRLSENENKSIFLDNEMFNLADKLAQQKVEQETQQQQSSALTRLMKSIVPKPSSLNNYDNVNNNNANWWEREVMQFMRGMMDECTHLKNFSVPYDTSLIIAICAKDDAYIPREGCSSLEEIWPGAEVRYLDAGHVSAYVLHQKLFRSCIVEAFERARKIYGKGGDVGGEKLVPELTYQQLLNKYVNSF